MITIPQPAMALNAVDVPGPPYKMWNTYHVPSTHTADHILGWTATVAKGAPGGKLRALVINCHGYTSKKIGGYGLNLGTGIRRGDTPLFGRLRGLVDEIYIIACQAARIGVPTGPGSTVDGDGNLFCCEIAKSSGATVYASTANQSTGLWLGIPFGRIDGWEGQVYRYNPDGSCVLTNL